MARCNQNTLISNASQFTSLPPGAQQLVKLSLLLSILKARNPAFVFNLNSLLANAGQFQSLNPGEMKLVKLQLYCNILGGIK